MLIDWFTVVAQLINFLVLVWLLKRFLYKPILDAIDAREQRVAAELADADEKRKEADSEREKFRQKNAEFDRQRAALMSQASGEAGAERQRLLDEAREAADALRAKRMKTLLNDTHNLNQAISRRAQQEVFAIARKALADLASASLEERMGEVFIRRIRALDERPREDFARSVQAANGQVSVRSAFELPEAQRTAISEALSEAFAADLSVSFDAAPELVSGIEVTAAGQKVAWTIAEYLEALEKGVGELVKSQSRYEARVAASAS